MKHGKKYSEAAKLVDRAAAYEPADAIALAKKTATAKFDETIEVHIRQAATDVMQSSRSAALLYFPTEQVKQLRFWFLQRVIKLTKQKLQEQIM